jgi:hypothetical protein
MDYKHWRMRLKFRKVHADCFIGMVKLLNGRLCSVSIDGFAQIWNMNTGVCEHDIFVVDDTLLKVVQLYDGRLVVSDYNRTVAIIGD